MHRLCFTGIFIFIVQFTFAQAKYWIFFKDKHTEGYKPELNLSAQTLQNRTAQGIELWQFTDIPVNQNYVHTLKTGNIAVLHKSKWLNAVSAGLTNEQVSWAKGLSFVENIVPIRTDIVITSSSLLKPSPDDYSSVVSQMNIGAFEKAGLDGEGVIVGVIDAGFHLANTDRFLEHLFTENRILGQRDFLDPTRTDIVTQNATDSDYHGRMVLDMICGYDEKAKSQKGMAINARFYLARTENGANEYRGEEDKWIEAMEWMDSLGVRLINTSLGYAINMDNPADNYKLTEMNGQTTRISKAAQLATDQKGIFLVVSAGNEGDNPAWRIISSPADAEGVLSIGATKENSPEKIGYSSIGPEYLTYLKPNVSCYSPNGTSFSAPSVTGFVACLLQKSPSINNKTLKDIVEKSAHLYPFGNNYIGYGVPNAAKAINLLNNEAYKTDVREIYVTRKKLKLKTEGADSMEGIAFHKKDKLNVTSQDVVKITKNKLKMKRKSGVTQTTLSFPEAVYEIFWQ